MKRKEAAKSLSAESNDIDKARKLGKLESIPQRESEKRKNVPTLISGTGPNSLITNLALVPRDETVRGPSATQIAKVRAQSVHQPNVYRSCRKV